MSELLLKAGHSACKWIQANLTPSFYQNFLLEIWSGTRPQIITHFGPIDYNIISPHPQDWSVPIQICLLSGNNAAVMNTEV